MREVDAFRAQRGHSVPPEPPTSVFRGRHDRVLGPVGGTTANELENPLAEWWGVLSSCRYHEARPAGLPGGGRKAALNEPDGDWKQRALDRFFPAVAQRGGRGTPRSSRKRTRPTVTCAICSPSSPCCGRRPGCEPGAGQGGPGAGGSAGALRHGRPSGGTRTGRCPRSSGACPARRRTVACRRFWRCATPWCEAGTRRPRCAIGRACSGARRSVAGTCPPGPGRTCGRLTDLSEAR